MFSLLAEFRKKTGTEYLPGNIAVNIGDEISELLIEIEKDNVLGVVDEFCDLVIFPINILEATGHDAKTHIVGNQRQFIAPITAAGLCHMRLGEYVMRKNIRYLVDIANYALVAIQSLGFNAELCVSEKAKCILSRDGEYSPVAQKWQKDKAQDEATIYQPDYNMCKI